MHKSPLSICLADHRESALSKYIKGVLKTGTRYRKSDRSTAVADKSMIEAKPPGRGYLRRAVSTQNGISTGSP